jgi:hypothetical protein
MRLGDWLEVIDEAAGSYRKVGRLVDVTSSGRLTVELDDRVLIDVNAHQVDLSWSQLWPSLCDCLDWFSR